MGLMDQHIGRQNDGRNPFFFIRCTNIRHTDTYLCCDLEVFMLFQQLLCVVNARASGCVSGQVKLPGVVDPFQGLQKKKKKTANHKRVHRQNGF